uniref:Uncharacterized protein n=1 Tax=Lepeophtheirus salmonis TaxID=72036 RepID=A0A0K2TUA1_LEPSM
MEFLPFLQASTKTKAISYSRAKSQLILPK